MSEFGSNPTERSARRQHGMSFEDKAELYKLASEEGKRIVDGQATQLESIRQKSVQIMAFVGAATAFLVGTGLTGPNRTFLFYSIATIASILSISAIIICISTLRSGTKYLFFKPHEWSFYLSAQKLVEWVESDVPPPSKSAYYRSLSTIYQKMYDENEPRIIKIQKRYTNFLAIVFLQLISWVIMVWMYAGKS